MSQGAAILRQWRADPVAFVRQNFQVEPDAWQADALRAFALGECPRISLQACAGPGKSAVLAWMGWNFIACHGAPGDHPKGVAVSVTSDNLKANLWPEFAKWQGRSPYLSAMFVWGAERIHQVEHKATWFLEARSWPKTASAEEQGKTLSGLHGGYVLALIDESGAIPPAVGRAAEQALSTGPKFGRIVQAGNPLSREGMLYQASRSPSWHVISITGDPDDPKRSPRIDIEWARARIAEHGRDDPWVQAYILGHFPSSSINTLLSPEDVERSMTRSPKIEEIDHAALILGVDVARDGLDQSALVLRQGLAMRMPIMLRNASSIHGAGVVAKLIAEEHVDATFVDNSGGFGAGWIDQLRTLRQSPIPVEFAGSPNDPGFANKRAEMWWLMAEWVKGGGAIPHQCRQLVAELTEPTYTFKGDKILVEPKVDVKKRLGRSPDTADGLALTFAQPVGPKRRPDVLLAMPKHKRPNANPFAPRKR